MTRRALGRYARVCLATAILAGVGCDGEGAREPSRLEASGAERSEAPEARALRARWIGEDEDAPLVVLLHGYGAPGDDLVPLARTLEQRLREPMRFALLQAPLTRPPSGRAWWPIEDFGANRPADRGDQTPAGLAEARRDVIAWLETHRRAGDLTPARTVVGGFSQGAMVATDVALAWDARPAGLVVLSGGPVDEARWVERLEGRAPPRVFMSHGRRDPLLAFSAAARLRERFAGAGSELTFVPFDGRHTIPPPVVDRLARFLADAL